MFVCVFIAICESCWFMVCAQVYIQGCSALYWTIYRMLISYTIYNNWACWLLSALPILLFTPVTSAFFNKNKITEIHIKPIENVIIVTSSPSL